MKAAVYENYGPPQVVQIREVPKPKPSDKEVLIRIHASTVSAADWRLRSLTVPFGYKFIMRLVMGFFKPKNKILGLQLAGVIEAIGKDVSKFKVGDRVLAECGMGMGAHAEYKTLPEDKTIAIIPPELGYEEAAALCFGGTTALDFLKTRGKIMPGEKVLVNGASGATGTASVQLAKYYGAEVTGVCSTANLDLVKSLGADHVIDYTKEDFLTNGQTYDIIVDTAGTAPWVKSKNSLTRTGRHLVVLGTIWDTLFAKFRSEKNGKQCIDGVANSDAESLKLLAKLVVEGHFTPVIDRTYPLERIVEAHAYVDTGRKRGSVVITMDTTDLTLQHVPAEQSVHNASR